jgi:hypothetical protein
MYSLWIAGVILAIVNRPRQQSDVRPDARLDAGISRGV